MKAVTLHQPWATLIAMMLKLIETRSWPIPQNMIGERIAIHAAKAKQPMGNIPLEVQAVMVQFLGPNWANKIPYGAIVATAEVKDCVQFGPNTVGDIFGDYSEGRYGWILGDIVMLDEPIPARGYQRLWTWDNE